MVPTSHQRKKVVSDCHLLKLKFGHYTSHRNLPPEVERLIRQGYIPRFEEEEESEASSPRIRLTSGEGGIIPQARVIQAHQPDEIVLLKTYFLGKTPLQLLDRLRMWINGSKDLIDTYSDLFDFIDLPHTPPLGFVQRRGAKSPHVIEIDVPVDDLFNVLQELESKHENSDFRFDILPGSKRVLTPVLLSKSLQNTKITYSLEEGGFLILHHDGEIQFESGLYVSVIDRFWLTGIPVYAKNNGTSISKFSRCIPQYSPHSPIEFRTSKMGIEKPHEKTVAHQESW